MDLFLISNFHHVLNVVYLLLGDSPASEFYVLMLQNTLLTPPMKMEQTECCETLAHKIQMLTIHPQEKYNMSLPPSPLLCLMLIFLLLLLISYNPPAPPPPP